MNALLLASALVSASACASLPGSGTIVRTKTVEVPAFTKLSVSGGVAVEVKAGPPSVSLEGDDNIVALYEVEAKDGWLRIKPREGLRLAPTKTVKAWVTTTALAQLDASGGVEVTLLSGVGPDLKLDVSGGVEVTAKSLTLNSLVAQASGGAELTLAGTAKKVTYDLSGGVELHAANLKAGTVSLDASGGCSADIAAADSVTGDVSGGVSVTVHGQPKLARLSTSGGTSVDYVD